MKRSRGRRSDVCCNGAAARLFSRPLRLRSFHQTSIDLIPVTIHVAAVCNPRRTPIDHRHTTQSAAAAQIVQRPPVRHELLTHRKQACAIDPPKDSTHRSADRTTRSDICHAITSIPDAVQSSRWSDAGAASRLVLSTRQNVSFQVRFDADVIYCETLSRGGTYVHVSQLIAYSGQLSSSYSVAIVSVATKSVDENGDDLSNTIEHGSESDATRMLAASIPSSYR